MGYVYPFDRDVITVRFAAVVNYFPPCGAFSATLPPLLDAVIDEYYTKAEHIDTLNEALAIVDGCRDLPFLNDLREVAFVSTDRGGFSYRGDRFDGHYCVMQVLRNPRNPAASVFYINCNDSSMLRKNLFTRRMILPSYYNGFHPYLNNEALIFRNGQYFAVRENGLPMVKVM